MGTLSHKGAHYVETQMAAEHVGLWSLISLMNIEQIVTGMQTPVTKDRISLYRSKILLKLLNEADEKVLAILP